MPNIYSRWIKRMPHLNRSPNLALLPENKWSKAHIEISLMKWHYRSKEVGIKKILERPQLYIPSCIQTAIVFNYQYTSNSNFLEENTEIKYLYQMV